jgi:hypothetical protein
VQTAKDIKGHKLDDFERAVDEALKTSVVRSAQVKPAERTVAGTYPVPEPRREQPSRGDGPNREEESRGKEKEKPAAQRGGKAKPDTRKLKPRATSQWQSTRYSVLPEVKRWVCDELQVEPTVDAFAGDQRPLCGKGWTLKQDAWKMDWGEDEEVLWVNPPFDEIERAVDKVFADGALAVVIAPRWTTKPWFRKLEDWSADSITIPEGRPVFASPKGKALCPRCGERRRFWWTGASPMSLRCSPRR